MELPPRQILIVDDDLRLLAVLRALMEEYGEGRWRIQTASDTAAGLSILQAGTIDLVIVDVHMPLVDGIQFLRLLQRRFPGLAKVVLTGDATGAHRQACLDSGADLYLEKPRAPNGWKSVFATVEQLTRLQSPESGFRGVLRQVELQDVLQMECLARSSSIFEVTNGKVNGRVYIQEGNFIHAEAGEMTGEPALNALLALGHGEFSLHPFADPGQRTIEGQWEFLLMEAARQRDESLGTLPLPGEASEGRPAVTAVMPDASAWLEAPEPEAAAVAPELPAAWRPQIEEVLLCSNRADVWHEWQCSRPESRIRVLTLLRHKAAQLAEDLSLGQADQLEIDLGDGRAVIQLKSNCSLFVRTSRGALPDIAGARG